MIELDGTIGDEIHINFPAPAQIYKIIVHPSGASILIQRRAENWPTKEFYIWDIEWLNKLEEPALYWPTGET